MLYGTTKTTGMSSKFSSTFYCAISSFFSNVSSVWVLVSNLSFIIFDNLLNNPIAPHLNIDGTYAIALLVPYK